MKFYRSICTLIVCSIGVLAHANAGWASQWDVAGQASLELRYFPYSAVHANQKNISISPSGTIEPELVFEWNGGSDRFTLIPFARVDADDSRRSHADLREASWLHIGSDWDLLIGVGKVFWGVTESVHLVDIVNQTDAVEDISGEKKLGQPMINFTIEKQWGVFNLIALPGFRARTFTADSARLHGPLPVDWSHATYESGKGERHIDWALRWSRAFGDVDVAISHFQGTSREALLSIQNRVGLVVLVPHYSQIGQTGLELQWTSENTLWKAEAISRSGHGKRFYATASGFEHTLYDVGESGVDVGLLMEYLSDNRDASFAPASGADHDLFAGARFVFNDTQDSTALVGGMYDLQNRATFINLEAEQRITDHLKAEINGRFFVNIPDNDPFTLIRSDDYVELKLNWFF